MAPSVAVLTEFDCTLIYINGKKTFKFSRFNVLGSDHLKQRQCHLEAEVLRNE